MKIEKASVGLAVFFRNEGWQVSAVNDAAKIYNPKGRHRELLCYTEDGVEFVLVNKKLCGKLLKDIQAWEEYTGGDVIVKIVDRIYDYVVQKWNDEKEKGKQDKEKS